VAQMTEDREVLAIVAAHLADMDALEQLDDELDDRCFDLLGELEERAEWEAFVEELNRDADPSLEPIEPPW
jgi:hypothetical protein